MVKQGTKAIAIYYRVARTDGQTLDLPASMIANAVYIYIANSHDEGSRPYFYYKGVRKHKNFVGRVTLVSYVAMTASWLCPHPPPPHPPPPQFVYMPLQVMRSLLFVSRIIGGLPVTRFV